MLVLSVSFLVFSRSTILVCARLSSLLRNSISKSLGSVLGKLCLDFFFVWAVRGGSGTMRGPDGVYEGGAGDGAADEDRGSTAEDRGTNALGYAK